MKIAPLLTTSSAITLWMQARSAQDIPSPRCMRSNYTPMFATEESPQSPYFQRAVVVAEYAEIMKGGYWAEDSSLDHVYDEAQRISDYLYRDDYMEEFVDLVRDARRMRD